MAEELISPHCDSHVLHSPGSCRYCDARPSLQMDRANNAVAFTNEPVPYVRTIRYPDPAQQRRTRDAIEAWAGNRAVPI